MQNPLQTELDSLKDKVFRLWVWGLEDTQHFKELLVKYIETQERYDAVQARLDKYFREIRLKVRGP